MSKVTTINGIEFEREQPGVLVHWGRDGRADLLLTSYNQTHDIAAHDPDTGEVLGEKTHCYSREHAVLWAVQQGFVSDPNA